MIHESVIILYYIKFNFIIAILLSFTTKTFYYYCFYIYIIHIYQQHTILKLRMNFQPPLFDFLLTFLFLKNHFKFNDVIYLNTTRKLTVIKLEADLPSNNRQHIKFVIYCVYIIVRSIKYPLL